MSIPPIGNQTIGNQGIVPPHLPNEHLTQELLIQELLIQELLQKKESTDPVVVIQSLNTIVQHSLLKSQNQAILQLLESFIGTLKTLALENIISDKEQLSQTNTLLMQIYPDVQEEKLKKRIEKLFIRYTTTLQSPDVLNNLQFIQKNLPNMLTETVYYLFALSFECLTKEQLPQVFSFICEHKLSIPSSWYLRDPMIAQDVPEAERIFLFRDLLPCLRHPILWKEVALLMQVMHKVPQEERTLLIQDTLSLCKKEDDNIGHCVQAMYKIPREERVALIRDTLPLFDKNMLGYNKILILEAMYTIACSGEERVALIRDTLPLFEKNMVCYNKLLILEAMYTIACSERAALIQDTLPLFEKNMNALTRIAFLKAMYKFPQAERSTLAQDTLPLCEFLNLNERISLLEIMHKIPHEERVIFSQDALPIYYFSRHYLQKVDSLLTISSIPKEERSSFVQELLSVLPQFCRLSVDSPTCIFYLLPKELRTKERLSNVQNLYTDPEYQAALVASLEQKLADETTPSLLQLKLAQFAEQNTILLALHEEHPVLQHAIEILAANAVTGEKNPFSLHKKLLALAKEPTSFQPQAFAIAGHTTSFQLGQLQASAKAFNVPRSALPQDATLKVWKQLVDGLKQKVEPNEAAQNALQTEYGTTWKELWNGCLSDSYLSGLLTLSGNVPIVEAQFRAILHHLLTKEHIAEEGKLFSKQEDLLIHQAMSIQHCSGGKKEGIAMIYKGLDPIYKYSATGLEEGNPDILRAKEFLAMIVQDALLDQFSGTNALMQELTGTQNINQIAHQAIYLKNLIGHIVGLHHEVSFDKHTGLLHDALVAMPREEVLQAFFRYFTPQTLVNELMRVINNDFSKAFMIVRYIVSDFEGWDYDEEYDRYHKINERGALQLLQTAEYLSKPT